MLRVKARGQRDLVAVVGHAATIAAGEWVQMSGSWVNDRTHGLQFKAAFLKASAPTTLEGIEKYLGSGMIRGIGPAYATKLVRAFGTAVFELIEQEPARLREVTGIRPTATIRVCAGISFALAAATGEGHCGLPEEELTSLAGKLLEVSSELIEAALVLELEAGDVVADTLEELRCVFLGGLYRADQAIAEQLRLLAEETPPWPRIDAGKAVPWVEGRTGLALAESQEALRLALTSKVLVITGGPGVGKLLPWSASGSPAGSGSTWCATCRCFCPVNRGGLGARS